jgi:uncharacterized protein
MIKWLLVIVVVVVIYVIFIKKRPVISKKQNDNKKDIKESNEMIQCATCGTYCAIDDTILSASKYYCSNECVSKA